MLYELINALVVMLTPILAYSSEEIYSHLRRENDPQSVQLLDWPEYKEQYMNEAIETRMSKVLEVRDAVTKALEEARSQKVIGHSLGASVCIYADEEWLSLLSTVDNLDKIFIVSHAQLKEEGKRSQNAVSLEELPGIWVEVAPASGEKCERCWIIEPSADEEHGHPGLCDRCSGVVGKL